MQVQAQTNLVQQSRREMNHLTANDSGELTLPLPWDSAGNGLTIRLDRGATYRTISQTSEQAKLILDSLEGYESVAVVSQNGGLLNHLSLRENLRLPSAYHFSDSSLANLDRDTLDLLIACDRGKSAETLERWMCSFPSSLGRLEKRLAAFVRALLSRPQILVFDHVFEGLTRSEVERVLDWRRRFHQYFPFRTLIFVDSDVYGLPDLADCVSVAAGAGH